MTQEETEYPCGVPKCKNDAYCGWEDQSSGKELNTCQTHLNKHYNGNDPFRFYSVLGIPEPSIGSIMKGPNTMAKKKKTKKTRTVESAGDRIASLFTKKGVKLSTREVEKALNKGKKPDQQATIHTIRAAIKVLIEAKQLVVVEVVDRQFVLAKHGTPVAKTSKKKTTKKKAKKKKKKAKK